MPGKKILVVDDDIQLCQLVSDILEEHGFQTLTAYNTDQAFKKLYENNPDLIVLDVWLPSIGGLEFCRQIRQDERGRHVPVLMLTVQDKEMDKVMGLGNGGRRLHDQALQPTGTVGPDQGPLAPFRSGGPGILHAQIGRAGSRFGQARGPSKKQNN
ncbi:MAG: response regulator [Elusimicrobia bacterium]|nr:response regulator [Elusimicrobiota bacterium]